MDGIPDEYAGFTTTRPALPLLRSPMRLNLLSDTAPQNCVRIEASLNLAILGQLEFYSSVSYYGSNRRSTATAIL
jgi:hypothetical protein